MGNRFATPNRKQQPGGAIGTVFAGAALLCGLAGMAPARAQEAPSADIDSTPVAVQAGQRVVRDTGTARLSATPALRPAPRNASTALTALGLRAGTVLAGAEGARGLVLGSEHATYLVGHRKPDGTVRTQCVQGGDAASRALTNDAPESSDAEELHHD